MSPLRVSTRVRGVLGDSRVWHKLLRANASNAKLETLVEMVGMGGMKEDMEAHLEAHIVPILKAVKKLDPAQPGRGKAMFGRVRILSIRCERLSDVTPEEVRRELTFVPVDRIEAVLAVAFDKQTSKDTRWMTKRRRSPAAKTAARKAAVSR